MQIRRLHAKHAECLVYLKGNPEMNISQLISSACVINLFANMQISNIVFEGEKEKGIRIAKASLRSSKYRSIDATKSHWEMKTLCCLLATENLKF